MPARETALRGVLQEQTAHVASGTGTGTGTGTVKFWKSGKGWGAIISDVLPDGADVWAHISVVEGEGYRELQAGDRVDFDYESARQDGFNFRATRVRQIEPGPAPRLHRRTDGSVEALPPE